MSYDDFYPKGVEPWEPNITAFLKGRLKWRSLVTRGTPIPTPPGPRYRNRVGMFKGAGYCSRLYRPQWTCKMKSKGHVPFCRVCARAIGRMMRIYTR